MYKNRRHPTKVECRLFCPILSDRCRFRNFLKLLSYRHTAKNRRFCCADSLTTSRSAGSCGILKERCSTHEIAAMTLFSAKFGCLLRSAECRWGVPGLLRHESPFKECVAENKTRIPIRQTNCYFSDSRRRVPWLLSQHRDMLFR